MAVSSRTITFRRVRKPWAICVLVPQARKNDDNDDEDSAIVFDETHDKKGCRACFSGIASAQQCISAIGRTEENE